MRKKVLIVCMVDSIHSARWLSQFTDQNIDFQIYSSKKHKLIHPELVKLVRMRQVATIKLASFSGLVGFHGYIDYFLHSIIGRVTKIDFRMIGLKKLLKKQHFDYVHALEIQGAGYLLDGAIRESSFKIKSILTNWGSDIYYFQDIPEEKSKIISALKSASYYSAECQRDYVLARSLGFEGIELPCIPNAGGFHLDQLGLLNKTSTRTAIIAKAYGGQFGRGDLILEALHEVLGSNPNVTVFLYSVTDDLVTTVEDLRIQYPSRVKYASVRNKLGHSELLNIFVNSRIYIGASRSDGISTSFLEALIAGCYPIQTDTSCADEWKKLGAVASVVPLSAEVITNEIEKALQEAELVDHAQLANYEIARQYLSYEAIKAKALEFYS